jgi:hypothetical protein
MRGVFGAECFFWSTIFIKDESARLDLIFLNLLYLFYQVKHQRLHIDIVDSQKDDEPPAA